MDIPQSTLDGINAYVREGIPTGGFLYAVLTNDLSGAFGRADQENTAAMREIVAYVYNKIPSACWGSPEKVSAWLDRHEQASAAPQPATVED